MRFICDSMLGILAKYLRMLGIDSLYYRSISVPMLIQKAAEEQRTLLTRRTIFLKKKTDVSYYCIKSNAPEKQLQQVIRNFNITREDLKPLCLCLLCNTALQNRRKDSLVGMVPEYVYMTVDNFSQCPACGRIYWQGTHYANMSKYIFEVLYGKL